MTKFISIALLTVVASASSAGTFDDNGMIMLDVTDRISVFDATKSGIVTRNILPPVGEKITGIQVPSRDCNKQCVIFINVLTDLSPQPYVIKLLTSPGTADWLR